MKLKIKSKRLYSVLSAGEKYRDEALLNISDDGILVRMHDASNTALYASHIPDEAMEEWEVGEFPRIGVRIEKLLKFLPNNEDIITLEIVEASGKIYKLQLNVGSREYKFGIIDPDSVNGVPDQVPNLDHPVIVEGELSMLMDFVGDVIKATGEEKGSIFISPRDGVMNLWGQDDDFEVRDIIHYEDFDNYTIDWSKGTHDLNGSLNPEEDHGCDSIISNGFLELTDAYTDTVTMYFGNHYPMKITSEWDCGIKQSWMIPPRVPANDQRKSLPAEVEQERTLVSNT